MVTLVLNTSTGPAPDTTPPSLTAPTATASGATSYTGSVVTDEAGGTLYRYVSQNVSESAATVKTGTTKTVTATGLQVTSGSGLTTETTYYLHYLHRDASGNDSVVVTAAPFTTAAAGAGTGTASISVVRRSSIGVAPEAVFFKITIDDPGGVQAPGDPADHDEQFAKLHIVTTFGDTHNTSSAKNKNLIAQWDDLNKCYGQYPTHTFSEPGTYSINTTVRREDGTLVDTASTSITIDDPDVEWPGTRTILVSAAGTGDGNYPGADTATSMASARTKLLALGQSGRILIKAGYTESISSRLDISSSFVNVYVGRYGGTTPWELTYTETNVSRGLFHLSGQYGGDCVVWGGKGFGNYNSGAESGSPGNFIYAFQNAVKYVMLHDMALSGFRCAIQIIGEDNNDSAYIYSNTYSTNWQDYGSSFFTANTGCHIGFLGSRIAQQGDAMMGGRGKTDPNIRHGPQRYPAPNIVVQTCSEFFTRNGWNGNLAVQNGIRFRTKVEHGGYSSTRARLFGDRCTYEGGAAVVNLGGDQGTGSPAGGGVTSVLDKVLLLGGSTSTQFVKANYPSVTIRNVIFVQPNTPSYTVTPWSRLVEIAHDGGTTPIDPTAPVDIYNCTFINLLSDANGVSLNGNNANTGTFSVSAAFTNQYIANNAIHQPNLAGASNEAIDVATSIMQTINGDYDPEFLGVRHNFVSDPAINTAKTTLDTAYATPASAVWGATPNASSPLLGNSTGRTAYDDFYGNVRGANPDRGAVERP